MEFSWSDEQLEFRDAIVEFARKELNDDVMERDEAGSFSRENWEKCAAMGLQGLPVPEAYGGQASDALTIVLLMEALGYGCLDNGLIFSMNAHIWSAIMPLVRFGSEEQKKKYLPGLCDGSLIGVQGMTEPGSGSDAFGGLRTRATKIDGGWRLDGTKMFITNAPVADVFVVFATEDPAKGAFGLSAFLVDREVAGVEVGQPFKKMGLRTSLLSEVILEGCEIPDECLLGRKGNGMAIFNHSMRWERSCVLASAIGTMERHVETSVDYAKQREQYGRPIGSYQAVSHRIVEMKLRLEMARLLLYRTAWRMAQGEDTDLDSAMTKLAISEAWVASGLDAIQVRGGYGYMAEYDVERDLRDAIAGRIYSGTSDIQRNMIARALGL